MATHSSVLAWRIPGTAGPGGLPSMGLHRVGHDWSDLAAAAAMEPVCCSMSSSNCCFLTCKQVSQEAGKVVCYPHLLKNFPQFAVIYTVKGFGIINKAEVEVFLEFSCFFYDPADVAIWSLVPLPFLNPSWTSRSSQFMYCWSLYMYCWSKIHLIDNNSWVWKALW